MDNVTKFLVYCVEIYKTSYKLNGRQVMQLFTQYGIPEYIVSCYGALHTTGPEYIIEDIAGLIADRRQKESQKP
jgi:type II restriction/modification system DNA methylase subunit YeeA